MEFAQGRSFYRLRCRAKNFGEARLGNLKFVIGQNNGGTMDSTHGAFKQTNGLWLCPTCEGFHLDLQNGHVDFAECSCEFCRMIIWILQNGHENLQKGHVDFAEWSCEFCRMVIWILQNGHVDFAEWSSGFCRMVLRS
jgi:hypothetical protein